jgi:MarR family transcriptional regulator for hemolysin
MSSTLDSAAHFRTLGFLMFDVGRLWGKRFDQRAKPLGLNRAQAKVLGYLARNEGINQAGLAELLEIEPITLVRLLDRMGHAGWVERQPDPNDRRAHRLYLGAKARPVLAAIRKVSDETREEALDGVSPREHELFRQMLERIHGNLAILEPIVGGPHEPSKPADPGAGRTESGRAPRRANRVAP